MIRTSKHKGLREFFLTGGQRGIRPEHASRLRLLLARLHFTAEPRDMNLPGLRLHQLKGDYAGHFAVDVSGNWRIIYRFSGNDAIDVDYVDYH